MKTICAVIAGVMLAAASATAADYHVSPSGKDDNSGTEKKPFKTIDKGVSVLKPGDTLLIHKGKYGTFTVHNLQGTEKAPITIKAPAGERAIIDRWPDGGIFTIHLKGTCRYLIFENLELTDSDPKIDELRKLDINKPEDLETYKQYAEELKKVDIRHYRDGVRLNPVVSEPSKEQAHSNIIFRRLVIHHLMGLGFLGKGNNLEFIDNEVYDLGYPRPRATAGTSAATI